MYSLAFLLPSIWLIFSLLGLLLPGLWGWEREWLKGWRWEDSFLIIPSFLAVLMIAVLQNRHFYEYCGLTMLFWECPAVLTHNKRKKKKSGLEKGNKDPWGISATDSDCTWDRSSTYQLPSSVSSQALCVSLQVAAVLYVRAIKTLLQPHLVSLPASAAATVPFAAPCAATRASTKLG